MSEPIAPELVDRAADKVTVVQLVLNLDAATLLQAESDAQQTELAAASVRIAHDEPNKAVTVLVGAALENMAAGLPEHALMALGAAAHLLRAVAASQLLGITS